MRSPVRDVLQRRWARVRSSEDRGLTLVEVLVSMFVFSIATVIVYQGLIGVGRYTRDVQGSADANFEVRQAVAQIDRQVRSGNVLYSPSQETGGGCTGNGADAGTCMRVYTQANGTERCVQWQVLADPADPAHAMLRSRSWSPRWQTDGQFSAWTTQARGLVLAPSAYPFKLAGATSASSSRYLQVRFEADDARREAPTVQTSSVSGRNTNYGYDGGLCSPAPAV